VSREPEQQQLESKSKLNLEFSLDLFHASTAARIHARSLTHSSSVINSSENSKKKRWPLILLDKPKRIQATRIRKAKYEIFKQFK
jgi:hypothetical protein